MATTYEWDELGAKTMDSRSLIAVAQEIEEALDEAKPQRLEPDDIPADFKVQPIDPDGPATEPCTCGTCGLTWDDAVITGMTPAPSGRCPFETFHDNGDDTLLDCLPVDEEEAREIIEAIEDIEGCVEDWPYGASFIRDDYFTEYAQEFAEDIGAVDKDSGGGWLCSYIDWDAAAEALQQDHTVVEFRGLTYYVR